MRKKALLGVLGPIIMVAATFAIPANGAPPGSGGLRNEGVGTYTDDSVAHQLSTFTINPRMISCGVGPVGDHQNTGVFAMLMYSTKIASYKADTVTKTIQATGQMRSITRIANTPTEDVVHDFVAIANDSGPVVTGNHVDDHFDVHFKTPFWNQASNPMCTPSSVVAGGCRFGGELLMGDIVVG